MRLLLLLSLLLPLTASAAPAPLEALLAAAPGLKKPVLEAALHAREKAVALGRAKSDLVAVIDYSLPSTEKRLWVLDTSTGQLVLNALVSHGRGSGELFARAFSNREESHQSSLGTFVTAGEYRGKHGRSLALEGLEQGVNDLARARAIVVHGAEYATAAFAQRYGRLGLSWGCPAVAPELVDRLIDTLGAGAVVFAWYPDKKWLDASAFVHG